MHNTSSSTTAASLPRSQQQADATASQKSSENRASQGLCCSRRNTAFSRGYSAFSSLLGLIQSSVKFAVDSIWTSPDTPRQTSDDTDRPGRQSRTAQSIPYAIAADLGSTALYAIGAISAPTFCAIAFASKTGILVLQIADTPLQDDALKALLDRAAERPLQTASELKTLALITPGPVSSALHTGGYIMDALSMASHAKQGHVIPAAISGLGLASSAIKLADPYVHFSPKILAAAVRGDHVRMTGGIMHAISSATASATLPSETAEKTVSFLEKSGLPYVAGQVVSAFLPTHSPLHPDSFAIAGISRFAQRRLQAQSCSQGGANALVKALMDTDEASTYKANTQTQAALIEVELESVKDDMELSADQLDRSNTTMAGAVFSKADEARLATVPLVQTRFTTAKDGMQTHADRYASDVVTAANRLSEAFDRVDEACGGDVDLSANMEAFCDTVSDKKDLSMQRVTASLQPVIGNASEVSERIEASRTSVLNQVTSDTYEHDVKQVLADYFNSVSLKEMPDDVQRVVTDMKTAIAAYNPSAMLSAVDINNEIAATFASAACAETSAAATYTDALRTQADSSESRIAADKEKESVGLGIFIASMAVTATTLVASAVRFILTREANAATDRNLERTAARLKESKVTLVRDKALTCWETTMNGLRCRRPQKAADGRVIVPLERTPHHKGVVSKALETWVIARKCGSRPTPRPDAEGDALSGIELRTPIENPLHRAQQAAAEAKDAKD